MTSFTPILAIPQVDQSQNNKYLTINDLTGLFEQALNKLLDSNTTGSLVLTEAQYTRFAVFKARGRSANFDITFPNTGGNITTRERVFFVWNADTTWTATVKAASTPGTTVTLTPGQIAICYQNGVDTIALFTSTAGSQPYDVGFFTPGALTATQKMMIFIFTRTVNFAGNWAGSKFRNGTNPTATAVLDVQKNGSSIGSISISTSGVATFTTSAGAAQVFNAGDYISVLAPASPDASLADVSVTFQGTR